MTQKMRAEMEEMIKLEYKYLTLIDQRLIPAVMPYADSLLPEFPLVKGYAYGHESVEQPNLTERSS